MKAVKCVCGTMSVLHDFQETLLTNPPSIRIRFCVYCMGCKRQTQWHDTDDAAIRVWNAMQEAAQRETAE